MGLYVQIGMSQCVSYMTVRHTEYLKRLRVQVYLKYMLYGMTNVAIQASSLYDSHMTGRYDTLQGHTIATLQIKTA